MKRERRNFGNANVKPLYRVVETKLQKLHPYTAMLEAYYNVKFGQIVTPIAILKTLAVTSSKFKDNVKIWVLHVAPSRHLKSKTTNEQMQIFSKKRVIYVGSDFTIHSLNRDSGSGKDIDGKCLLINDLTLLLASKADRTKSRLIDAFSELASEGKYIYGDWQNRIEIEASFSLIANITPKSYFNHRDKVLGNTFTERCIVVYHQLTPKEMRDANLNRDKRNLMKIDRAKEALGEREIIVTRDDLVRFDDYAKRWQILSASPSSSQMFDIIKSIAIAHAILSKHTKIMESEYAYLDKLEPYLRNPFESIKMKILELAHQGRSIRDICLILNQDYDKYRPFVSRTIREYRIQGVLPPRSQDQP